MPDACVKNCVSCDTQFGTFKRKHHCRYCGLIFCSVCTRLPHRLPNGTLVDRCCEQCYSQINKDICFLDDTNESSVCIPEDYLSEGGSFGIPSLYFQESDEYQEDYLVETLQENAIEVFIEDIKSVDFAKHEAFDFLGKKCGEIVDKKLLSQDWLPIILKLVKQTVETVISSVLFRKDLMNLNRYLRIIKIPNLDRSHSKFIKGIVFKKNVAHKRMRKNITQAKLLMLEGFADFFGNDLKFVSMDTIIDQESEFLSIFVKKIEKVGANMVLVEKGMSQSVINELQKLNITAFINVKRNILDQIARVTQGKVLSSIDQTSHMSDFVGECEYFNLQKIGKNWYVLLENPTDETLGGSLIIAGETPQEVETVKEVLQQVIVLYRNLKLEKLFFNQISIAPSTAVFGEFDSESFSFKYLFLYKNKLCKKPKKMLVNFYKNEDKALGEFVVSSIKQSCELCYKCRKPWKDHRFYFVKGTERLSLSMQVPDPSYLNEFEIRLTTKCSKCSKQTNLTETLKFSVWEYSLFKFISNFFSGFYLLQIRNKCKHDAFKDNKFIFEIGPNKIEFTWEPNQVFELLPNTPYMNLEALSQMLESCFGDLKLNALKVIEDLREKYIELRTKLTPQLDHPKLDSYDLEMLIFDTDSVFEEIKLIYTEITELKIEDFENFLEVETMRRKTFLGIIKIKSSLHQTLENLVKISKGEKLTSQSKSMSLKHSKSVADHLDKLDKEPESKSFAYSLPPDEKFFGSSQFQYMKKGSPTLPTGINDIFIPVEYTDPFSIISYVLNSQSYQEEVLSSMNLNENKNELIENELLAANYKPFKTFFSSCSKELEHLISNSCLSTWVCSNVYYNVSVFFPRQFHAIRLYFSENHFEFLLSIAQSLTKESHTLGKSGATFRFSHDKRYILKTIEEKEFKMFVDLAPNYFRHTCKKFFHAMPSRLVKALGAFCINTKKTSSKETTEWLLLFENLNFNMHEPTKTYDLKGALNQKRKVLEKDTKTKMDLNFLEDFQGLPINLPKEIKRFFDAAIWNDCLFLSKQNIVDYSLLIKVNTERKEIAAGIIDYIGQYTFERAIESKYKKVVGTEMPTITHPASYKNRFRKQLTSKFFMSVEE